MGKPDVYALTWRLPIIAWQSLFFVGPLLFMVVISFYLVRNYRMTEAFELVNWQRMLSRDYFWDSYLYTLAIAGASAVLAMLVAFPAAYALAFRASASQRRLAVFLLVIPFFSSYLVRTFAWYVILAESGVVNAALGRVGLGPYTMLNTHFGTVVGYLTLVLPLAVILQTVSMASIDRTLVEAARNLGCRPLATLWRVIVPLARTGLIVALLFCFILSFGDFVAPFYLGGSQEPTLPILILDTTKSGQQWPRAAVVAVMMMVTLFAVAFAAITLAYRRSGGG